MDILKRIKETFGEQSAEYEAIRSMATQLCRLAAEEADRVNDEADRDDD